MHSNQWYAMEYALDMLQKNNCLDKTLDTSMDKNAVHYATSLFFGMAKNILVVDLH